MNLTHRVTVASNAHHRAGSRFGVDAAPTWPVSNSGAQRRRGRNE